MKDFFIPTANNNYTPRLLSRGIITFYTLVILLVNIVTADVGALKAHAALDTQSLLELHNQERQERSLPELTLNSSLNESARAKAKAMMLADCWDHYCPDGKSPWDFFEDAGYDYIYAGENLAEGFTDNQKVFNAWMNSETHRENILRAEFSEIGIAIEYGTFQGIENNAIVVVHFGDRNNGKTNTNDTNNNSVDRDTPLKITYPPDNALLNSNTFDIEGESSDGTIIISDNNVPIGETDADQGIFTYRIPEEQALVEGAHRLSAQNQNSSDADQVNVIVDTIPPTIGTLFVQSVTKLDDEKVILQIETSADTLSLETPTIKEEFYKKDATTWEIEAPIETIFEYADLKVIAYDNAGNKSEEIFTLSEIKGDALTEIEELQPLGQETSLIEKFGIRRILNTAFIVFILSLLIVDYIVLANTELPAHFSKSKRNYHLSIFLLLLLISLTGGTTGELLEGAAQ